MRVLIILASLELGGAERQALLLARHLAREQRAAVEVWGFGGAGDAAGLCDQYGIPWRGIPLPWPSQRWQRPAALARFIRELRRARPEVLLPFTNLPNVLCGLVWRFTGARLCVWNQRDEGLARRRGWLERWAARRIPLFVANSAAGAEFLRRELRVPAENIHVIRNGIDLPAPVDSRAAWRQRLEISENTPVGVMLASLSANKDHETVLRAWKLLLDGADRAAVPPVLVLAGRPLDTADRVRELIGQWQLGAAVRLTGHVEDVAGLLGAADCAVFSSRSEGSPNAVLECMTAGLPVAATDIAGIREALGPDAAACLAPPGDAAALADRIRRLVSDPALRQRLGAANRLRARECFSAESMGRQMAELIEEAQP